MAQSSTDRQVRGNSDRDAGPAPDRTEHLSEILTDWKMIRDARGDATTPNGSEPVRQARQWLWERYERAIRRYLLKVVNDSTTADEIYQEFALRMFQGAFRHADPERGKFRKYLKTSLSNLIRDHFKKTRRAPKAFPEGLDDPADDGSPGPSDEADLQFLADWREVLLKASWERLRAEEDRGGRPHLTALRLYIRHDGEGSAKLAERLSEILKKPVTAAYFNKQVHNARKKHALLLIDEVARTLDDRATASEIEEELIALGLHDYPICRDALREYRGPIGT